MGRTGPFHAQRRKKEDASSPDDADAAFNAAVGFLARRRHSRQELRVKLLRKGFGKEAVETVLDRCGERGYLDDAQAAKALFHELAGKLNGARKIRHELRRKGLDGAGAEDLIAEYAESTAELANAKAALEKGALKYAREPDRLKRRQKMHRFLDGRGFSAATIRAAIDGVEPTD